MSVVEVRDYVLWSKHIQGNPVLRNKLLALEGGALVKLDVDGIVGTWVKMDDAKTGAPTPGLKPLGAARDHSHGLFREQRGTVVEVWKA